MSVSERTQKDLMDYISLHSKDWKLTESLLKIAEQVGYSNATIHRTLKSLEAKGLIEIAPSSKPTEPNTIIYKGKKNEIDDLLARGVQLSQELGSYQQRITEYVGDLQRVVKRLEKEPQGEIVKVLDLPEQNLQIVTLRKDYGEESVPNN